MESFVKACSLAVVFAALISGCAAQRAGAAPDGEARLAQVIGDRVAGKPVNCIAFHQIRSSRIIDRTAIVYEVSRGVFYLNRPRWGEGSLRRDSILLTRTSMPQLCDGEVVRLLDPGIRFETGAVALGDFVPYSLPKP